MFFYNIGAAGKIQQAEYGFSEFLIENIYLIIALLVGIIVAILMRNTLKKKP